MATNWKSAIAKILSSLSETQPTAINDVVRVFDETGNVIETHDLIDASRTLYDARCSVIESQRDETNAASSWHCSTRVDDAGFV